MSDPSMTTRDPRLDRLPEAPASLVHDGFGSPDAASLYDPQAAADAVAFADRHMPDEVTRDHARRMHYAAYRWKRAKGVAESGKWRASYLRLRDEIVLGNRKLIYQAVRRRMAQSNRADDLVGDCHIVLIQAVAAYNPWLGIRFSTYAYTCLVRALSRMAQRIANDRLARSASLDLVFDAEPTQKIDERQIGTGWGIDEFLHADHPLLDDREKTIITRRYGVKEGTTALTLAQVGQEMGLSKERVRQMQATALDKLRIALTTGHASS